MSSTKTKTWVISDTHFGHSNIIKYTNRPFDNSTEMDETIIENWNRIVSPNDFVYHLGDFAFVKRPDDLAKYTRKLKGRIILLKGNHDKLTQKRSDLFYEYHHVGQLERKIEGMNFVFNHYPMLSWNRSHHGAIHGFGHVHSGPNNYDFICAENSYDCGVDNNNYTPILIEELIEKARDPDGKFSNTMRKNEAKSA